MIKKVSSKKKKDLVRAIKNPNRYFKLDFGRYGGEVAMGEITKAQYDYWIEKGHDEFSEYMSQLGFDILAANKDIPKEAQFDREFYEYNDICHLSGPELAGSQTLTISECDKDGHSIQDEDGNFIQDKMIDVDDFKKYKIKTECVGDHHTGSSSCKDKYFMFGQYFNKGGWYTEEIITTDHKGLDLKKLKINYENADGFRVFYDIQYDGYDYYLQEDSTGKSSAFYVMAGESLL